MKRNLWIWAVAGAMALPQIGTAQFGPKPPQPQQPGKPPVVVVKPGQPQPAPAVKPAPKPQPPVVVKPAAPLPAPPKTAPAPVPVVVYRPGHKNHPLQPPKERDHYKDWAPLHHKRFYRSGEAPTMLQVSMRVGQEVEFKLEEKTGDGLKWFVRCDPSIVDVDVEHERPRWYKFSRTAYSEVEIEARRPGNTIVELVYARPNEWDLGNDPQKVIQIFVHIE
ncbi:MAG: protease inhibitor I42 family protein [Lentisphaeria bacterium]|nr:protease inhibitor I42 family protein [Lentisphaeria bacterium]